MNEHIEKFETASEVEDDQNGYSLPAWVYSNEEFFELERDEMFMPSWQVVCHVNDIPEPGNYHTFRMLGQTAFVIRDKDGSIKAFHNVCRHRAARLLDGDKGSCGGRITCPYHAWSYGFDGKLIGLPEKDQYAGVDISKLSLVPIDAEIMAGFIFIRFQSGGPSVQEMFAPVSEELAHYSCEQMKPLKGPFFEISERIVNVNWKNGVDNYADALHVRAAHPGLNSLIGKTYGLEDRLTMCRLAGSIDDMKQSSFSERTYNKILPEVVHLPEDRRRLWVYFMFFPMSRLISIPILWRSCSFCLCRRPRPAFDMPLTAWMMIAGKWGCRDI